MDPRERPEIHDADPRVRGGADGSGPITAFSCFSSGQEAVAVGVCAALQPSDQLLSQRPLHRAGAGARPRARRGHGRAAGQDDRAGQRQGRPRPHGQAGGRASSAPTRWWRAISASPRASRWRCRLQGERRRGRLHLRRRRLRAGALHETLNIAALWRLPLLLVCDNNQLSVSTGRATPWRPTLLSDLAEPFGIPGATVDGMDVLAVREAAAVSSPACAERRRARRSWSACPIASQPTRPRPARRGRRGDGAHAQRAARSRASAADAAIAEGGSATPTSRRIEAEIDAEVAERAAAFADASPYPDPAEALRRCRLSGGAGRSSSSSARRSRARVREEMAADRAVIVLGQDVGAFGGSYKEFARPLRASSAPARVRDTPVAEAAMVGARRRRGGGGSAAAGQHHLHGLPDAGPRSAGELRRQGALQDRRPDHRARGGQDHGRRQGPGRRPLPVHRGVADGRARPEGGRAVDRRPTPTA